MAGSLTLTGTMVSSTKTVILKWENKEFETLTQGKKKIRSVGRDTASKARLISLLAKQRYGDKKQAFVVTIGQHIATYYFIHCKMGYIDILRTLDLKGMVI